MLFHLLRLIFAGSLQEALTYVKSLVRPALGILILVIIAWALGLAALLTIEFISQLLTR